MNDYHPPKMFPSWVIHGAFILGLASSLAFRAIAVLSHLRPAWVRPVWYAGVFGYIIFFMYRYYIARRRRRAVAECGLIEQLQAAEPLTDEQRRAALYVLGSVSHSRENLNYYAIFVLSAVAVVVDQVLAHM